MKLGRFFACLAMVGVGAVVGTLSGGYTDAARSPDLATGAVVTEDGVSLSAAPDQNTASTDNMTVVSMATTPVRRAANEPAPSTVIAARFPGSWQQQDARASNGDADAPAQILAFAAEARRGAAALHEVVEPVRPATASVSGFRLASVDRNAEPEATRESTDDAAPVPMPKRMARPAPAKPPVLFNDAQIASIKTRLRLSRDQEQYWPQVESALRAISWKIATTPGSQRQGGKQQAAMIDPSSPEVARLKSAAFPLIMSMRSDQKEEVRQLAHTMGLKQVASMF